MPITDFITTNDPEIESQIIKKMVISKKVLPDIKPEYFTFDRKPLVEAILRQFKTYGTLDRDILFKDHPVAYDRMINMSSSYSPILVDKLYKMWVIRESSLYLSNLNLSEDNVIDSIKEVQVFISNVVHKNSKSIYNHGEEVQKIITAIQNAQKENRTIAGKSTGLIQLDKYSGGIEKGKMYAIGALKKGGKSRFGLFLSTMLKKQNWNVYWNSLEMSKEQLNMLAVSHYSGIDSKLLETTLPKRETHNLQKGFHGLYELNWNIYKDHFVSDLQSRLLSMQVMPDVIFLDFYQRMKSPIKYNNRAQELDDVAQGLADLSRDMNIAMIVFSQLSGRAEDLEEDEIPDMRHFKESQGIVENADQIWTMKKVGRHESPLDSDGNYKPEIFNMRVEQRYGISGAVLRFVGDLRISTFYDLVERNEHEEQQNDGYDQFRRD